MYVVKRFFFYLVLSLLTLRLSGSWHILRSCTFQIINNTILKTWIVFSTAKDVVSFKP